MKRKLEITYSYDTNEKDLNKSLISALEAHALTTIAEEAVSRPELREGELTYYDLDSDNEAEYHGKWEMDLVNEKSDYKYDLEQNLEYFNNKYKIGDLISFKLASNSEVMQGKVANIYSFGLVTVVDGKQYALRRLMDIELIYPPLRSVKVTFSDGNYFTTSKEQRGGKKDL